MRGWHFVGATLRDGRPVPPDGEWLVHEGPVKICESGLHFSEHPFDALQYAAGSILCHVDVEDVVERQYDKGVARRRRILQRQDVANLLCAFARQCALDVAHLWMMPAAAAAAEAAGDAAGAAAWAAQRDRFAALVETAFREVTA